MKERLKLMYKFDSEAFIKEMESLDGVEETPLDFEEFESWYEEYQQETMHRSEKNPRFQIQPDKRPLSPGTSREAGGVPCLNPRRGLTLLSPVCRDPAIGV